MQTVATYICKYVHTNTGMCTNIKIHMYTCMCTHMDIRTHTVQLTSKFTIALVFLQGSREISKESHDILSGTQEMHE